VEEGRRQGRAVDVVIAIACAVGCGDDPPPPSAPGVGKVLAAVLAAADDERTPWRCAALDTPFVADAQLVTGPRKWQLGGHMLRRIDSDDTIAIGVIADAAGASPRTIAMLSRLRVELEKSAPDLVISLGGMGATQADLVATLGTLAEGAPWPVVSLPGDLEPASEHVGALSTLRARGAHVLDGRLIRWIELPGATIATIPGAGAPERLVAGSDGCSWHAEDVAKLYSTLTAKPGVRIVASSEAPRSRSAGEATGELGLVPAQPIEVALHGPAVPTASPARSGGRDGGRVALTPGTADGLRRLPDAHTPSAGLLVIRGGTWSWRPVVAAK
jgi:hypothetical protein